ncbi:hypothetical protein ULMA_00700 [Patiriisocius marinus]|uniref:Secretion system C-terminal sorting domain-containing protein n=1 Tax=Patiriisocius marinus TaxID=1397112 RepID=A0A5J4IUV5_9FLAO|nr:FG-GAP-like repeat-containing protein [Patiriisocius marinus]GER57962.1 hypothetical protein ULMA_00700 [Patiriisocius marinus]
MKIKLLVTLAILGCANAFAQIDFAPHIISDTSNNTNMVYAVDVDGDGDIDVVSSSGTNNTLTWHENVDGKGAFEKKHIISTKAETPYSIFAADINLDGTMDVLSASGLDNKIAWYQNDGKGNFSNQQVITTEAERAYSVYANDVDGDGDMDVISGSLKDNKVAWYENLNGKGDFSEQKTISTEVYLPYAVHTADLDNDGDKDIIATSASNSKIIWFENTDGKGTFSEEKVVTNTAHGANKIFAIDIDGDNDLDVVTSSLCSNEIIWYQNTNGKGKFGAERIITGQTGRAKSVFAIDMDGDGDNDVLSASFSDNKIAWYQNTDGKGTFGPQLIISEDALGAQSVYAVDIDNDGDVDVVSASGQGNGIVWYENLSPLGVDINTVFNYSVFPNPARNTINLKSTSPIVKVQIFNQLLQMVLEKDDENGINKVDISTLQSAIYLVKVKDANANYGIQKLIKDN